MMVEKITNWIKTNKITTVVIMVLFYSLLNSSNSLSGVGLMSTASRKMPTESKMDYGYGGVVSNSAPASAAFSIEEDVALPIVEPEMQPKTATAGLDRIVVQNSSLSLVVGNVRDTGDKIIDFAESKGGFMVTASYNQPEQSPFANITVRVPTKDLGEALNYYRDLSEKIVSESLVGRDVTEQYVDIEGRLATLEKTKTKFEVILDQATEVDDILRVQRELIYLQDQIDSYTGRLEALQEEADLTKVTIYLSTDELSLPYTPDNKFRPNVVFKLAVRSLMNTFVGLGEKVIWVAVYSVFWGPVLIILLGYRRWKKNKSKSLTSN